MEILNAAEILAALGHESCLSIFRLLVEAGPAGINASAPMSLFERYLTVWVFLCIVAGIALGQWAHAVFQQIGLLKVAKVYLPVGLLIWVMIVPMLVKPFSMAFLGWLFIRSLFAPWLPAEQIDSYIAGLILLAAAPCTAMVFVWSRLSNGDPLSRFSSIRRWLTG